MRKISNFSMLRGDARRTSLLFFQPGNVSVAERATRSELSSRIIHGVAKRPALIRQAIDEVDVDAVKTEDRGAAKSRSRVISNG